MTQVIAEAGVNLDFLMAQVIGRKYVAVLGFENEADAEKASALIKKAAKKEVEAAVQRPLVDKLMGASASRPRARRRCRRRSTEPSSPWGEDTRRVVHGDGWNGC